MKVNQIAAILNETINQEQIGESAVVNEDLSNIVDVGRQLDANSIFNNNFDNFTKSLIDRIGKVIFVDRPYKGFAPDLQRDGWEYGAALQKVRCDLMDAEENKTWTLADLANGTTVDPFVINKPSISAKYYNNKSTFEVPITLGREQVKEAFASPTDMNRFFAMIENRIQMKQELSVDAMEMRVVNNLIANKIHAQHNVVNLLTDYNALYSTTLTVNNALTNSDFLKYAAKQIMLYKKYLSTASMLYNNDGYVTFTPESDLKMVVLSEFAKSLEVNLYSDTFNEEFVKLTGYVEIPYWQGSGSDNSFANHANINITAIDPDSESFSVNQSGVIGVMFDRDAAMICNTNYRTVSIFNPKGEYWNYFYKYDTMYMNDLAENCVVFVIAETETV